MFENSIIVNNLYYTGDGNLSPTAFEFEDNNVIKEGDIHLRTLGWIDDDLPITYMHVMTDSLGSDLGAGLFKNPL